MTTNSYITVVNGVAVPMTAAEIATRQAEEAAWAADAERRIALTTLRSHDVALPRVIEDLIDAIGIDTSKLPAAIQARLQAKRDARKALTTVSAP